MKIGIDLGGTNIRVGLVENGSLVRKEVVTCPSKATYEEVLGRLEGLIDRVMCPEVAGIGVGVPSVVDSEEGIVYNVANIPSWTEVPLKRLLQERFSVPVYINNDSNCFALGVKLFGEGLTAQSDYEEAKQAFLNKQQGQEQMMTSLSSAKIQEAQLQQNILETQMERSREANNLVATLKAAYDELQVGIEDWKMTCLFISPANGILSYNDVWQKNQNVNSGDKVFSIVASQTGDIIGKIKLPVNGSGKVKPGQRVNISVTGYPYMEFGFLTGKVVSVSLLTDDKSMYTVTVSLPQDLRTSYGKVLEFKGELTGIAEVMTDERSVTGRLFGPLRYLWEKYLS